MLADLPSLHLLALYAVRTRSFDFLRQHPALEILRVSFGGVRDLEPLTSIPNLVGLDLYRIQGLSEADLAALSRCQGLEALALDVLPHVHRLDFLQSPAAGQLRLLVLGAMKGLASYAGVETFPRLGGLVHYGPAPEDRSLTPLLSCPHLQYVLLEGRFEPVEIQQLAESFTGDYLLVDGEQVKAGIPRNGAGWSDSVEIARRTRPEARDFFGNRGPAWRD